MVLHSTVPTTEPEIDDAAIQDFAVAISRVARAYFTATLGGNPRADYSVCQRFVMAVDLAAGNVIRQEWRRCQDHAESIAADAIQRAFRSALGAAP